MLIGTSFGACLKSIIEGEVSEDDVLVIITRTDAKGLEGVLKLAESYYNDGNPHTMMSSKYDFDSSIDLDQVKGLAARLYLGGKIHQPRQFGVIGTFIHPELSRANLWLQVSPVGTNKTPAVIEAYERSEEHTSELQSH